MLQGHSQFLRHWTLHRLRKFSAVINLDMNIYTMILYTKIIVHVLSPLYMHICIYNRPYPEKIIEK